MLPLVEHRGSRPPDVRRIQHDARVRHVALRPRIPATAARHQPRRNHSLSSFSRTETGPFTVDMRTTVGRIRARFCGCPRRPRLFASLHAAARLRRAGPSDSTTTPDRKFDGCAATPDHSAYAPRVAIPRRSAQLHRDRSVLRLAAVPEPPSSEIGPFVVSMLNVPVDSLSEIGR